MKIYRLLSILLISLCSIQISFWYDNCDKEYQKYLSTYEEVEELVEEKAQLKKKIEKQYPSASQSFIMKKYNKETEDLVEEYKKLETELDSYWEDFNVCKKNTEKQLQYEDDQVSEYFQQWYTYHNAWDYLNAIKYYKKAEEVYSTKEAKSNLSLAYFEYANGRFYKERYDEAIEYYNLALKEWYLHTYNIYFNIGLSYQLKAWDLDASNLKKALDSYKNALNVTSDITEIQDVKIKIQEIDNILNYDDVKNNNWSKDAELDQISDKQEEHNQVLIDKANTILDKIDDKTQNYSLDRRLKLYEKYISVLQEYSNTRAKGDIKYIVDFIVKWMQRKVDNKFEPTLDDILGL